MQPPKMGRGINTSGESHLSLVRGWGISLGIIIIYNESTVTGHWPINIPLQVTIAIMLFVHVRAWAAILTTL